MHLYPAKILVFFYCYGDHRSLHSFPTRRSSDLVPSIIDLVCAGYGHAVLTPSGVAASGRASELAIRPRSEEHTSELQSHLNLVCRLLLEKKKKFIFRADNVLLDVQTSVVVAHTIFSLAVPEADGLLSLHCVLMCGNNETGSVLFALSRYT